VCLFHPTLVVCGEAFGVLSTILTCQSLFHVQSSAGHTSANTAHRTTASLNTACSIAAEESAWREGAAEACHLLLKALMLMVMVFALCQGALWAQAYLQ
jgi:hypothetical protein